MTEIIYPSTLANALQSSVILPGSRLLLRGGNYLVGDLQCKLNNVTIMPYDNESVTIIPANGYRALFFDSVSNVTVSGLTIDGSNISNECIKITGNASNIHITNCEIRWGRHAILMTGTVNNCEIDHCNIHHNGLSHLDHGVYLSSDYAGQVANVHHNTISNNASNGVHAYGGDTNSEYTISHNYLFGNGEVGIGLYHGLASVYNNIVRGSGQRGITCRYALKGALIVYNTIIDSGGQNLELNALSQEQVEIVVKNNLFLGGGGAIINPGNVEINASNNLEPDWTYITNDEDDVRPLPGSEAIGGGISVANITDDYAGNERQNPPTIGAYEYV